MRLVRLELALNPGVVRAARNELLDRISPGRNAEFRWGYVLGVEERELEALQATRMLDEMLRRAIGHVVAMRTGRPYALSFFKACVGMPPEVDEGVHYDGFHLDTHPEVTGDGRELTRVLVNLAPTPRALRFAHADRYELARRGVFVDRSDYQVVDLPADVRTRIVEIPALEAQAVHALHFWASVVPHVGVEAPAGHFLASYEAVDAWRG